MDLIKPIFYGPEYVWDLNLTPDEARSQLEQLQENSSWWEYPIRGRVRADSFVLARKPGLREGSKVLTGEILPTATGCRVKARFRLTRPSFMLASLLLAFAYLAPLFTIHTALASGRFLDFGVALLSLGFPVLGTLPLHAVNWLNRWNERILADSVGEKLAPFAKKSGQWYSTF